MWWSAEWLLSLFMNMRLPRNKLGRFCQYLTIKPGNELLTMQAYVGDSSSLITYCCRFQGKVCSFFIGVSNVHGRYNIYRIFTNSKEVEVEKLVQKNTNHKWSY